MIRFSQSLFVRNLGPDPIHPHRGQPVGLPLGDTVVSWNHNHQLHSTPESVHGAPLSPRGQTTTVPGIPTVDQVPNSACSTHPTSAFQPSSSVDVLSLIPSTAIAPREHNFITEASADVPSSHSLEAISKIQDGTELNLEASDKYSLTLLGSPGGVGGRRSLSMEREESRMTRLERNKEEHQLTQEEERERKEDKDDHEERRSIQEDGQLKKEEFKSVTGSSQCPPTLSELEEGDTMEACQNSVGLHIAFGGKTTVRSSFLSMDELSISSRATSEERSSLLSGSHLTSIGTDPVDSEVGCLSTTPSLGQYEPGTHSVTTQATHNKPVDTMTGDVEKEGQHSDQAASHDTPTAGLSDLSAVSLEAVAPLRKSANRWIRTRRSRKAHVDMDSPYIVDRKVRALLNKLTMTNFESITDQIIAWANKSEKETDGRTLIQVIRLIFEKATDEAIFGEVYARLCRKMMEQISSKVQDDEIKNADGKPILGGQLFRKYLLNRCQEDFERGWGVKELPSEANDKVLKNAGRIEERTSSDEFYVSQKARQRGLGLVKFIGELFKLQMLTERIMHECVKKLLSNIENPEEEEIESLCKLLATIGQTLDHPKARAHIDVYFTRMRDLNKNSNVSPRIQFSLQDIIELREREWVSRKTVAGPAMLATIHEMISKRKLSKTGAIRAR